MCPLVPATPAHNRIKGGGIVEAATAGASAAIAAILEASSACGESGNLFESASAPLSAFGAQLILAIQRRDVAAVRRLLRLDGNSNSRSSSSIPKTIHSSSRGSTSSLNNFLQAFLLLLLSADSNRKCDTLLQVGGKRGPFASAAAAGREEMMLRLLELCHEDAAAAAAGNTLLHLIAECAASTRAADAAAKAAASRQPVDGKAKLPGLEGWTPLLGADPTLATGAFNGRSPLLRAAATGAVCGILRLDEQRKQTESSGVQQQHQQQREQLIPPCETDSGLLPIHLSCFGAHRSLARILLQTGSRIDAVTEKQKWTPLHFAAASGSAALAADLCRCANSCLQEINMVKVLLAFGADPLRPVRISGLSRICFGDAVKEAEEREEAITALHVAVLGGSAEFVGAVLQLFKLHVECFGTAKRLDVCAALVNFAAAEAPPDVAAEACGLERILGVADEALSSNLVEVLKRVCLSHHKRGPHQHTQAGLLQKAPSPRLHAASEEQLKQLFATVANRLLEQAVLRNFAQVTERILEIGLYDKMHAERALQEAASLGRAEICQLLVNAGAATAASAYAGKGPFELLAKAMQQQQNHMLLLQQHRILAAAAAAATVSPAAHAGSKAASHAAAAALEAAASATIKSAATAKSEQATASTACFAEEIKHLVCVPSPHRLLSAEAACDGEAVGVDAQKANAEPDSRLSPAHLEAQRRFDLAEKQMLARSIARPMHLASKFNQMRLSSTFAAAAAAPFQMLQADSN
ncbi:hypothetical protein Emag_001493 [Eimeria magna]